VLYFVGGEECEKGGYYPNASTPAHYFFGCLSCDHVPQAFAYKDAASIKAYVKKHFNTP
jgi:hypothetical protein